MHSTGTKRLRAAAAVLGTVGVLAACAGENLFTGVGTTGGSGPTVEITTPAAGLTKAVGDSILIEANVNAPAGGATAVYTGVYEDGVTAAYVSEETALNGLSSVTLSNRLRAAPGQVTGAVKIILTVTDLGGDVGADTVSVTIAN